MGINWRETLQSGHAVGKTALDIGVVDEIRIKLQPFSAEKFAGRQRAGAEDRMNVLLASEQVPVLHCELGTAVARFKRGFAGCHLGENVFGLNCGGIGFAEKGVLLRCHNGAMRYVGVLLVLCVLGFGQSAAAKFTASGCAISSLVGGAMAGMFHSGTTGTCTVTITMGNKFKATNGWACVAWNLTTGDPIIQKIGDSTTTAVIAGPATKGDVVSFMCRARPLETN